MSNPPWRESAMSPETAAIAGLQAEVEELRARAEAAEAALREVEQAFANVRFHANEVRHAAEQYQVRLRIAREGQVKP